MICSGCVQSETGGTPSDFGVNGLLQAGVCDWLCMQK